MPRKQIPIETGWHIFGQAVGIVGAVALILGTLHLLFVVPYERHKEVLYKLERLDAIAETTMAHYRNYMTEQRRKE